MAGFAGWAVPRTALRRGNRYFPVINVVKGAAGGNSSGFAGGLTFDMTISSPAAGSRRGGWE